MATRAPVDAPGAPHHASPTKHLPGRVALAWTLAGGVTAGGLLVASVTLLGGLDSGIAPTSTTILFVLGALAGYFHGGVLGFLARDLERPASRALWSLLLAGVLAGMVSPLVWVVSLRIGLTHAFVARGEILSVAGTVLAWAVGVTICAWAAWEGLQGLRRAFLRWPERRYGSVIIAGILAILLVTFLLERPRIWGTEIQVRGLGAVILALGATIWIALPTVLAALHGIHRLVGDAPFGVEASSTVDSINGT
ncbi:MAG: hypothetical protein PVI57_01395 [Gemmatimonadota bacterium]